MTREEFNRTAFYPGIRVKSGLLIDEISDVQSVDFETGDVWASDDGMGNIIDLPLSSVEAFLPPEDYSPCSVCGVTHHPQAKPLCRSRHGLHSREACRVFGDGFSSLPGSSFMLVSFMRIQVAGAGLEPTTSRL